MSTPQTFNSAVAARTRTADEILQSATYLAIYVEQGGRPEDLRQIVELGQRAELQHQEQTQTQALGGAATATVKAQFQAMRREHSKIKAIVQAVAKDLGEADAPIEVQRTVQQILTDESEKVLLPFASEEKGVAQAPQASQAPEAPQPPKAPQPRPRRRAVRSKSQEAVRAEVQKDTGLLIQLEAAHPALAERKVDLVRLRKLHSDAQALSGKLATRSARKGEAKGKTRSLRGTVAEQRRAWGTIYPLLEFAAQTDPRIAELLAATRKR